MKLLIFDYHYIGPENRYLQGIYPVSSERLENQIKEVMRYFTPISQQQLIAATEAGGGIPENSCLITFDDGLRSQFDVALPILKRMKVPAVFFVSSLPYVENRTCLVHKIHFLRATLSPEIFLEELENTLQTVFNKSLTMLLTIENENIAREKYRYDTPLEAKVKYFLNNILDDKEKDEVISIIFHKYVPNEEDFIREFYMQPEHLKELRALGYLGLHSFDHVAFSRLSLPEIREQLARNKEHLESIAGSIPVESVSYPYGSKYDINSKVVEICQELGIKVGFTKERAINASLKNPLLFARADTNDVVGGKNPLFRILEDNTLDLGDFPPKRSMWVQE